MTDPQFPDRPDHADFWALAAVLQDFDSAADDGTSFARLASPVIDPESLVYMASQRAMRAAELTDGVQLKAAWMDGFMAGALFQKRRGTVDPSAEGRNNLADVVEVYAHHSSVHDGINVEIDAPAGTRVTVHLNDGMIAEVVVPS